MSKMPRGFTLLEVMLAIAIFSTLSFLASMVFSQASEQHQRAKKTADNFDAIQHTMLLFENDLLEGENGEMRTRLFILTGWFPETQKSRPTSWSATGTAK